MSTDKELLADAIKVISISGINISSRKIKDFEPDHPYFYARHIINKIVGDEFEIKFIVKLKRNADPDDINSNNMSHFCMTSKT